MLTILLIVCALIWLPVLLYQISHRGFVVLLIWLLIAPVASNLVNRPGLNPLFRSPSEHTAKVARTFHRESGYFKNPGDEIKLRQLFEPTRILLGAFLVVFLLGSLLERKRFGPFDRTEIWMGAFSLILLAGVLLQSNVLQYSMRVTSDAFIVPFCTYFVVRRFVTSEDRLRQLIQVMGYTGCSLIVIGLIERLTHQGLPYRLAGPFRDPGILFVVLAIVFFLVLSDSLRTWTLPGTTQAFPPGVRRFVLYLVPVITLLTWSRGNWVGFLMSVWVFLFLGRRLINRSQKFGTIGLALILIAVIGISAPSLVPSEIREKRVGDTHTVYGRIATWKIVIREGIKHPILGIGLNNTRDVLAREIEDFEGVPSFISVHNSFVAIFVEQGSVGLLAYLAIVASIIRMGLSLYQTGTHSRDRWRGVTVIAIMVAYLTPALFASLLHVPDPMRSVFVYAFVGGIAGLYRRHRSVPTLAFSGLAQPSRSPSRHGASP